MLFSGAIALTMPFAGAALAPVSMTTYFYPIIGVNSPTAIYWIPSPNILQTSPLYAGKEKVWADASVTFTRPDGTTSIVNGPFEVLSHSTGSAAQGLQPTLKIVYTPNMIGNWSAKLTWPGDSTYASITKTDQFTVGAHFEKRTVFAVLSMDPYPKVGLGQNLLINAWVTPPPFLAQEYYQGYMFTFTKPDGTKFNVGPMDSEAPGTVWFDLPLDQIGNWTIKFDFPGDHLSKPATVSHTVTVQKDWTQSYPDTPLPTDQWDFPINVENREWRNIAGAWTQSYYNSSEGAFNPYTQAPKTAHILWTLEPESGIGGYIGSPRGITTGAGDIAYGADPAGIYSSSTASINTVMAGRGYYNAGGKIHCINMQTGEELWTVSGSFNAGATRSRLPVLYQFGTNFTVYDGLTGAITLNVPGMSMTFFYEPYVVTLSGRNLIKWDTTPTSTNFTSRILWNVTNPLSSISSSTSVIQSNLLISKSRQQEGSILDFYQEAVNLTTGALEYRTPIMDTTNPSTWIYRQGPAIGSGFDSNGRALVYYAGIPEQDAGRGYHAFDAVTGKLAWTSEPSDYPWGGFWAYMPQASAYGMNFGLAYSGVYAFNLTNGKIVWHYVAEDPYSETPYGDYQFGSTGPVVGGGVVFAPSTEHSPTFYYRGQALHAIDAFTGKEIWNILGIYSPTAIAYGTLVASDSTNGATYAFAKGQTATTVSVQNDVYSRGSSILIKGTVTDQSPAQKSTPAISDASMTGWMEYLHMQQPKPTNATGVKVHLTALDSNGNTQEIGTVISDVNGLYRKGWTPPIEGEYTVIATFEGSEAYYASHAETVLLVGPATPSTVVSPTPTQTINPSVQPTQAASVSPTPTTAIIPPTSGTTATTYIAIVAAVIIIVAAAAALILRKRRKQT